MRRTAVIIVGITKERQGSSVRKPLAAFKYTPTGDRLPETLADDEHSKETGPVDFPFEENEPIRHKGAVLSSHAVTLTVTRIPPSELTEAGSTDSTSMLLCRIVRVFAYDTTCPLVF